LLAFDFVKDAEQAPAAYRPRRLRLLSAQLALLLILCRLSLPLRSSLVIRDFLPKCGLVGVVSLHPLHPAETFAPALQAAYHGAQVDIWLGVGEIAALMVTGRRLRSHRGGGRPSDAAIRAGIAVKREGEILG
jgi:hypothetical protein